MLWDTEKVAILIREADQAIDLASKGLLTPEQADTVKAKVKEEIVRYMEAVLTP